MNKIWFYKYRSVLLFLCFGMLARGDEVQFPAVREYLDLRDTSLQIQLGSPSYQDLRHLMLRRNPEISKAYAQFMAARSSEYTVSWIPDPELGLGYFLEAIETAQGPQRSKVSISQRLPWPSKISAQHALRRAETATAEAHFNDIIQGKLLELRQIWNQAVYLNQEVQSYREILKLLQDVKAFQLSRYATSTTSHAALINTQVEEALVSDALASAQVERDLLSLSLQALLATDTVLELRNLKEDALQTDSTDDQGALEAHPRLAQVNALLEVKRSMLANAQADLYPDAKVGFDYIVIDPGSGGNQIGRDAMSVSVGLALPLWNWKARRARIDSDRLQAEAAQLELTSRTLELHETTSALNLKLNDSHRRVELYEATILPSLVARNEVLEQQYVTDEIQYDILIQAKIELIRSQLKHAKLKRDLRDQNALIEFWGGNSL